MLGLKVFMNKKETIENIKDVNSLIAVVTNLCEKIGLTDVNRISESVLSAVEKGALKDKTHKFVVTLSELGGKVQPILDICKKYCVADDEVVIISSNQKKISEYFQNWIKEETKSNKYDFWNQEALLTAIDKHLPEYWGHADVFLKKYEEAFLNKIEQEIELKSVLKLDKKFDDLLNVFIEPKLFIYKEDKESQRPSRVKIQIENLLKEDNFFISGDAGTGKSTLLKQLGKLIIQKNKNRSKKHLPIQIKTAEIQNNFYSVQTTIEKLLLRSFGKEDLNKIFGEYHLVLLIDSIDEFESAFKKQILEELNKIVENKSITFIMGTRNYENLVKDGEMCPHHQVLLSNFDQRQVKQYLDTFFKFDLAKSEKLWESLVDNHILDRIPVTPLTISLVSILYEEKQYEVPATLTDVYDNFNLFLLGRLTVKSRLEFLDINVKERVLSIYALQIIKTQNRTRKTKSEFLDFVKDFFSNKSITIKEDLVPELLNSLTEGTGILYVDEKGLVTFKHDHFMEYYASREIFIQHDRKVSEAELIEKFTEYNWQNTAIFYAGRTKDMPEFLKNLIDRIENYTQLNECLLAISGMGHVLQSLWMTDSQVRKDGVVKALDTLLKADRKVKELANDKFHFFKGIRDIDVAMMNLFWFYNHFNSVVIRDPLNLAFDSIREELTKIGNTSFEHDKFSRLFQLFCIASTLNTGRNEDPTKLKILQQENDFLKNPLFVLLFDNSVDLLESRNSKKLKDDFKLKTKISKYKDGIKFYLDTPSEDLRFTTFDKLMPIKKIELFVEGKTDAEIISHAFGVLVPRTDPNWNISSPDKVNKLSGGANELRKHIEGLAKKVDSIGDKSKIVIALFDNDAKGNQEFGGLDKNFNTIDKCLKKHKDKNIYAVLIPIPLDSSYDPYRQEKQEFKFFEIEHYFSIKLLQDENMVKDSGLPGVYEIKDKKSDFANKVSKLIDPVDFKNFTTLFNVVDEVSKTKYNYIE